MKELAPYLLWWRTTVARDRVLIDAVVAPEHRAPSAEFERALADWPGTHYWVRGDGEGRLALVRLLVPPPRERWWLHALLFITTFLTVWMGGTLLAGSSLPLAFPFSVDMSRVPELWSLLVAESTALRPGLDFAMALMAILLAHECGHYLTARRYGINASPPFFLPAPPILNFIGTFGAFIRLRSPVVDRRQLLDVGAAGPWAGFVVAMVALTVGLARSQVFPDAGPSSQLVMFADIELYLGDSPILYALRHMIVGDETVLLHPLAVAGWFGLFVTTLNLLPLGQLDGGHILYALLGQKQEMVSGAAWFGLIVLGFVAGRAASPWIAWFWWTWAIIILVIGRGRLAHPQVLDRHRPLTLRRQLAGWITMVLFAATFCPVPIYPS
ncbi:MAG: site-2 protease family protein [Gemmatimonadota bacterium]|nr:site-2 protease family protein [Gemmatimonadota bacterium]